MKVKVGSRCETSKNCINKNCVKSTCTRRKRKNTMPKKVKIGAKCEISKNCINNNCVDKSCVRRPYTKRRKSTANKGSVPRGYVKKGIADFEKRISNLPRRNAVITAYKQTKKGKSKMALPSRGAVIAAYKQTKRKKR